MTAFVITKLSRIQRLACIISAMKGTPITAKGRMFNLLPFDIYISGICKTETGESTTSVGTLE